MGEIQFDNEQEFVRPVISRNQGGLIALAQKWGIAKDEQQARYVLLGIAAVSVCIMLGIYFFGGSTTTPKNQLPPDAFTSGDLPR